MKLAVLADIHGNLPALEAVLHDIDGWNPDKVIVAGDVINRGPKPRQCWEIVHAGQCDDGWQVVYGNHEEYVLAWDSPNSAPSGAYAEIFRVAEWTREQLGAHLAEVRALPESLTLAAPDDGEVRVRHGSMLGTSAGIFPRTPEDEIRRRMHPPPALFLVAHTHRPLVKRVDDTLIVNVGAVGLPFDGDHRACYARVEWTGAAWEAHIVRLPYDYVRAERDFVDTGFLVESGPLGQLILVELREARSQLYQWTREYEAMVVAGELTLLQSVDQFLRVA